MEQEFLDGQHGVESPLNRSATGVESAARATAPVDTGEYLDSIHIETDHTDRMVKRVISNVPYAMIVEARDGVLARALDAAGGS